MTTKNFVIKLFVTEMLTACVPLTRPGYRFISFQPGSYIETVKERDVVANLRVRVSPRATFTVVVHVNNVGTGAEPTTGTIGVYDGVGSRWDFYCELVDEQMQVTPMEIHRQRAELKYAVQTCITRLGGTEIVIKRRLKASGFDPSVYGLASYINQLFVLNVEIRYVVLGGVMLPQITATRPGTDLTFVLIDCFSIGMEEIFDRELSRPQ
jgi:hypothetical protein